MGDFLLAHYYIFSVKGDYVFITCSCSLFGGCWAGSLSLVILLAASVSSPRVLVASVVAVLPISGRRALPISCACIGCTIAVAACLFRFSGREGGE